MDLYGKLFADRGYISQRLFDDLFEDGIQLVTGIKSNMEKLVHSRHRSLNNFIMNLVAAMGAYCFYENKPIALGGYEIEASGQLFMF